MMEYKKKLHRVHGIMPVLAITAILYARNNRADLKKLQ